MKTLVGENHWIGDKKPTFHWVSLSPVGQDGDEYDALGVDEWSISFLQQEEAALEAIQRQTRCTIRIPKRSFWGEHPREIGFCGTRKAVEETKALITAMISDSNGVVVLE